MKGVLSVFGAVALCAAPALASDLQTVEALQKQSGLGVQLSIQGDNLVIESNGRPSHGTGNFPMMNDSDGNGRPDNPNRIETQTYRFSVPLNPTPAPRTSALPMGPVAVSLGGAVFYNAYTAEKTDAVKNEIFDACKGHPDMRGRYHYHQFSPCVPRAALRADGHVGLMGWAFDGFELYGVSAEAAPVLDACQGHKDAVRGYHYHMKSVFPYVLGCYRGTSTVQENRRAGGGAGMPLNRGSFRMPPRIKGRRGAPPPRY